MPNYCYYTMKAKGTQESVNKFIQAMQCDYNYCPVNKPVQFRGIEGIMYREPLKYERGKFLLYQNPNAWKQTVPNTEYHMFRVFEANVDQRTNYNDGLSDVIISGYCAWSVDTCMFEGGYYSQFINEGQHIGFTGTTIPIITKELGLTVEVFSEESGLEFEEHMIVSNGTVLSYQCFDVQYVYDENEEEVIERSGGFGEAWGKFII